MEGKSIDPLAEGYVVEVLCTFTTIPNADPRTLHLNDLLRRGLDSKGNVRREYLRITGDLALFISGIFPDSFMARPRKTAYDVGYFIDIGRIAYNNIETEFFTELAENFPDIVDALNDVSVQLKLASTELVAYLNRRRQIDARTSRR